MDFYTEMKNAVISYLSGINVEVNDNASLSELLEIVKKCNPSAPSNAVGALLYGAIREFDSK